MPNIFVNYQNTIKFLKIIKNAISFNEFGNGNNIFDIPVSPTDICKQKVMAWSGSYSQFKKFCSSIFEISDFSENE